MQTSHIALAAALLFCTCILLHAQPLKKLILPGFSIADTSTSSNANQAKKAIIRKYFFQNVSTFLGNGAGQKIIDHSQREKDSLQQIILLRKKF